MSELETVIPHLFFLRDQTEEVRKEFVGLAVPHSYPKGNLLFYHGEPSVALYVVLTGRVKISLFSDEGREVILTVIRPGGVVGLDSALDQATYFGTASTLSAARLARISLDDFLGWLRRRPAVLGPLLLEFARRLRHAYEKIGEQALLPVKQRLLMALREIAQAEGTPGRGGEVSFVRPTHQELAELVGSSRVVITRLLKELVEEEKLLMARGNVIRVYLDDLVPANRPGG